MEHYHTLDGGGIAEDKRMINAKTPWTLAHLEERVLKAFYNNPAVPPSMRTKLKMALMIKPTLKKKKLKGGLKGVSKASGFIRRLMWENSHKHSGAYGNPTWALAPGSKMNKPIKFDYKKLANAEQGGEPTYSNKSGVRERNPYGASPFIEHHFKTEAKKAKAPAKPETDAQKKARMEFVAKYLLKKAKGLIEKAKSQTPLKEVEARAEIPEILQTHFANIMGEPPVGLDVRPASPEPEAEAPTPPTPPTPKKKTVLKSKKLRVFVDADTGEVLHDERKPKEPEAPPPPPAPKREWTEAMVQKSDKADFYKRSDDRKRSLFLFALNNPKAKLAGAVAFLKEAGIGKGFAPSTISPIYKSVRGEADELLAKTEKDDKLFSSPAFQNIKGKLDKLLANKKATKADKATLADLKRKKRSEEYRKKMEARKAEEARERKEREDEKEREALARRKEYEDRQKAEEAEIRAYTKALELKDAEAKLPILDKAIEEDKVVVFDPTQPYEGDTHPKKKLGTHRSEASEAFKSGKIKFEPRHAWDYLYAEYTFKEYRDALKKIKADALKLEKAGAESKAGYGGKMKHDDDLKLSGRETPWEKAGTRLTERLGELGLTTIRNIGFSGYATEELPRPNAGFRQKAPEKILGVMDAKDREWYKGKMEAFYEKEDVPRMKEFLKVVDKAIAESSDAELRANTVKQKTKVSAEVEKLKGGSHYDDVPAMVGE